MTASFNDPQMLSNFVLLSQRWHIMR